MAINQKPIAPSSATVGITSATALAANGAAANLVLTNDSDTDFYLAWGTHAAVLNKGVLLASGASLIITANDERINFDLQAIASAASKNMAIQVFEHSYNQ